jgi:NTP pyrophosphatase (non-canonical NTP hydrolase)
VLFQADPAIIVAMTFQRFQTLIETMYSAKDRERGSAATFLWLSEEVGELAAALREGTREELAAEFADVLAWLATLANVEGIDLTEAIQAKYGSGCPGCGLMVCTCNEKP